MKYNGFLIVVLAVLLLSLQGCGGNQASQQMEDRPVDELYSEASDAMERGRYVEAARLFEEVERQHPYSQWATRAELMAAFAYYRAGRYDESIIALDRFIELHPGSEEVDYALYLRALCYYEQISDVARDQAMTQEALNAFDVLVRRFPDSRYTRDASLKRDLVLDHLAGKEMEIGRYYLNRNEVNAAMNRFRTVVRDYQTTTHVPEALHRLTEIYMRLGLRDEAIRVAAVLGHNYPGSSWYRDSYRLLTAQDRQRLAENRSWLNRTVDSLFRTD